MFADILIDFAPAFFHLGIEDLSDRGHTTAAAGAGFGAGFDAIQRGQLLPADGLDDIAFADVVARADLDLVAEIGSAVTGTAAGGAEQQLLWVFR
jgi:hypothetical protein